MTTATGAARECDLEGCSTHFVPRQRTQRYCSVPHQQRAYYAEHYGEIRAKRAAYEASHREEKSAYDATRYAKLTGHAYNRLLLGLRRSKALRRIKARHKRIATEEAS